MKRGVHTTLDIKTIDWLNAERKKYKTTMNDILEKAITFYKNSKRYDPLV